MKLAGLGLVAVLIMGCSPAVQKIAATPSSATDTGIPSTREAESDELAAAVGTTSLTAATFTIQPKLMLPAALWDHWDEPPTPAQTWGVEPLPGPDGF